jgi:hypothetical protein
LAFRGVRRTNPDAIVLYREPRLVFERLKANPHATRPPTGKGVLDRIRYKLVDYQTQHDRLIHGKLMCVRLALDCKRSTARQGPEVIAQALKESSAVQRCFLTVGAKLPVHASHHHDLLNRFA